MIEGHVEEEGCCKANVAFLRRGRGFVRYDRLVDFVDDFEAPADDERLSFFVLVGAAPLLLFVVVTAPLFERALFKDLTKTVGSLDSFGAPLTSLSMSR